MTSNIVNNFVLSIPLCWPAEFSFLFFFLCLFYILHITLLANWEIFHEKLEWPSSPLSILASKLYDIKILRTILCCPLPLSLWLTSWIYFSFLFSVFVLYFVYYFIDQLGDFPWETRAAFLSLAHPNPSWQWEPSLALFKQADFCGGQQKRRRNYCV